MILSSFAFHTALLVTTFVFTPHATAANSIKSLTKSSSSSMVPNEGLVKTQQQRQSKNFHDLLLRSTNQEMENTAEYETKASLLSTALQILSNFCDNAIAALTATWKRASDLLFMTAASHQDKPTRISNSTWFAIFNDLMSTHGASHQVRDLLTQILQPSPPPPSERLFTLENTNSTRPFRTFCLVSLLILATSTMETLQRSIPVNLPATILVSRMACYPRDSTNRHMYQYAYQKMLTHVPPSTSRR